MKVPPSAIEAGLRESRRLSRGGEVIQAELLCAKLLETQPSHRELRLELAGLVLRRGDLPRALQHLEVLVRHHPADLAASVEIARLRWRLDDPQGACVQLETSLGRALPGEPVLALAWLLLGKLRSVLGRDEAAARAWHQAFKKAGSHGPAFDSLQRPDLRALLEQARREVDLWRHRRLSASIDALLTNDAGADDATKGRLERALRSLLKAGPPMPADPRQRPQFFYFPDLPSEPYLDPMRLTWARRLLDAFPSIREEALELQRSGDRLPSFLDFASSETVSSYLGGTAPAWDAFFFYRRGERYDDNHRRCPVTSEVLDSIDLFRIPGQSPEICFSFLAPGTTIKPHFGVSNARLVLHLPLLVPPDCALNLVDVGEYAWREGELLLFDDTYQHEAWNRSDETRIVLLMDCWNPGLTPLERRAVKALIQASGTFDNPFGTCDEVSAI